MEENENCNKSFDRLRFIKVALRMRIEFWPFGRIHHEQVMRQSAHHESKCDSISNKNKNRKE